jgi:hypothetical protein
LRRSEEDESEGLTLDELAAARGIERTTMKVSLSDFFLQIELQSRRQTDADGIHMRSSATGAASHIKI